MDDIRIGFGYDLHRLTRNESSGNSEVNIKLGGVSISAQKQVVAHSDGDILIHAIVDSILGALGMGDIGNHFPNNDPKWSDADSAIFLEFACRAMEKENYKIVNLDVTLVTEEPRISPVAQQIKLSLAKILQINPTQINIKGNSGEGVGAIGRGEAIACYASILLRRNFNG